MMKREKKLQNYTLKILNQLTHYAQQEDTADIALVVTEILHANHIFLAGAGRSGLAVRGLGNRLLHLGFAVSIVGEISSPHSQPGDLLIICSGSGETTSLKALAQKAAAAKVKIILFSTTKESTIAKLANYTMIIPGKTKTAQDKTTGFTQPMGSVFEQLSFLTFDGIVMNLMDQTGETSASMFQRHADFE